MKYQKFNICDSRDNGIKTNIFIYQYARSFVNNCSHFQAVKFNKNILMTIF